MKLFRFRKQQRNYENVILYARPGHRPVTVEMIKAERLRVKNERRAKHNLQSLENYAHV